MLKASDYIDAVIETIESWNIPTVLFNPEFNDESELNKIETPAVFVLCDTMNSSDYSTSGNGSMTESVDIDFVCVIAKKQSEVDSVTAAFNLASFVKRKTAKNNWGLGRVCGSPEKLSAINATGNLQGFSEWRVSFQQTFEVEPLSEKEYDFNEVFLGINPKNDDDFELIGELDE